MNALELLLAYAKSRKIYPMDTTQLQEKPKDKPMWDFKSGFILAFILLTIFNSLPFADAARFKKAMADCERNLPRDQFCDVQAVPIIKK